MCPESPYILPIPALRQHLADELQQVFTDARIVVRTDDGLGDAALIHLDWLLPEPRQDASARSQEVSIQVTSGAMRQIIAADARERGGMVSRFVRVVRVALADNGYNPQDPPYPPFLVRIDEHSLD